MGARALIVIGLWLAAAALPAAAFEATDVRFCDTPGVARPCAALPHDVTDFDSSFIYRFLSENAQFPFDQFSWQTFVALNWPVDAAGAPLAALIGTAPEAPRRWQELHRAADVFAAATSADACGPESAGTVTLRQFRQASGEPLIDRTLNYAVYGTRLNDAMAAYVQDQRAGTCLGGRAGPRMAAGQDANFSFLLRRVE